MVAIHYALLLSLFAGLAIPLGGLLARFEHISNTVVEARFVKAVTAFGGGALLSAIALVLVPEGAEVLPVAIAVGLLLAGGVCFALVDAALARAGGSGALVLAMMLDFLPEAMALGALLVTEAATAKLLAAMMFLQNLPEGFAAFREIWMRGKLSTSQVMMTFLFLAALGPICAGLGLLMLADQPEILGAIMMFAAGGILYLIFQDVAPEAHEAGAYAPALGAVAGFALGMAGNMVIG